MFPVIDLEWPHKDLSPNSRKHWAVRSKLVKAYRWQCAVLVKQALVKTGLNSVPSKARLAAGDRLCLQIDFYPPDRRHRDDDNVIASFKAGRDGLADALGIDDRYFTTNPKLHRDDPIAGGLVRVKLSVDSAGTKRR